jgi:hypothetical protein
MSVKINASSSSGLVVDSDLTGSLQLQTGGNPAISIDNAQVANFAKQFQIGGVLPPAFSAYQSSTQTLASSTLTKIQFQAEEFDTNNNFDSTTNYRFTPTVAGYYQVNACLYIASVSGEVILTIYKNGVLYKYFQDITATAASILSGGSLVYMNGTTDYLEIYGYQSSGVSKNTGNGSTVTWFNGAMVRSA